ncbi:leucine-rich repeat-containing G-protein coupled receptor 4-like [Culicoides brevitarsis]|uniref:leucine-rich repeat-containing G-protein coupled receptor 4-like n=1 Tax=Culicoides brevitarsis TaxID=469753 RepID=UPI00307B62F8
MIRHQRGSAFGTQQYPFCHPGLLDQIKNVTGITMVKVQLRNISDFALQNATKLQNLLLSFNNLTEIGDNTFSGAINLENLNLAHNCISKISSKAFVNTPNLKYLGLGFNKLEEIDAELFLPLKNLWNLSLYNNKIKYIAATAFTKIPNLLVLYLNHNNLESLELHIESRLSQLYVSYNKLKSLTLKSVKSGAMSGCVEAKSNQLSSINIDPSLYVVQLYLSSNKIESLDSILSHTKIFRLNLDGNLLRNLDGLNKLKRLTYLDLSSNNITYQPDVFGSLQQLNWLNLSNTSMTHFSFEWFGIQKNLFDLELSRNLLKELDYKRFSIYFPNLDALTINNNQFNCTFLEDMMTYWKNMTQISIWDAKTVDPTPNVANIKCINEEIKKEVYMEESKLFGKMFVMISCIGIFIFVGFLLVLFLMKKIRNKYCIRISSNNQSCNELMNSEFQ